MTDAVWISVAELARTAGEVVLLDVRYALGDPNGHDHYLAGHLPGAVYVDLDTELAGPPSPAAGRHPLPDPAQLQQAARRWGIRDGAAVVAYDDWNGMAAARAWWLLRWAGLADVRMLDGGYPAWTKAGHPTESGEVSTTPGDVTLRVGAMPVLDADAAGALARTGILLDARAGERYRGETEPIDPRAGHIPGARSVPTAGNLDADGLLRPHPVLIERFAGAGAVAGEQVGVYCGSGVTAAHQIAVLAACGIPAALYPGSWSQWSADPGRPAATGPDAG